MTQPTGPATAPPPVAAVPALSPDLKPGYHTTELIVTVLTAVGMVVAAAADWLPPRYAAICSTIAVAAYSIARGLAKLNPPKPTN